MYGLVFPKNYLGIFRIQDLVPQDCEGWMKQREDSIEQKNDNWKNRVECEMLYMLNFEIFVSKLLQHIFES